MNSTAVAFGNGFSKNYETNMWLLQKMIDMNFAIIGGLGTGLGGGLTTIGNPVANSGRFANWFYKGAENPASKSLLEELGTSSMTNSAFKGVANLTRL